MTNNQSPSKFPFKMRISGRFFTEGILSLEYKQRVPYSLDVIGSIQIDLENNLEFQHVDFKDDIEIYKEDKLHFKGFVTNYQSTDKIGTINFRDYSLKLEDEKITAEFINMNPTDSLALLTQSSGFLFRPSPKIPYNTDERDFVLIIPVLNLTTAESFKIGNVEFYQKFDTIDDSLIQNSETGKKNLLWSSNFPRAKIIIKSRNFFDAIIKGYASISKTIDIIALRTDISFPSMNINADYYRFAFNHDTLLSKVKIPTCVYCREKNSQAIAFFDIESINEKKLSLNVNSQGFFKEVITLCDDLIEKDEFIKDENNFLQVLHWLRKAIQEGNDKDKFLDLWIAFEFLISGEKTTQLFTPEDKIKIQNLIGSADFNETQNKAINSKINMLNDSPLMEKFNQLMQKLGIRFSEEELVTFKKMRDKRTNLIHGKGDISINDNELKKMRTILEKLFIAKINASKNKL